MRRAGRTCPTFIALFLVSLVTAGQAADRVTQRQIDLVLQIKQIGRAHV